MDGKLLRRIREQTVQLCDADQAALGTGFFVTDNIVVTVRHCLYDTNNNLIRPISFYRGSQKLGEGYPLNAGNEIVFIYSILSFKQEDRLPIGYCDSIDYGDQCDVYGYPRRQSENFPMRELEITGNFPEDGNEAKPSIQCMIKNKEGGLDQYDGLSGSPMMIEGCILGIAATEDGGKADSNALHFYDFSRPHIREIFKKNNIDLKNVVITRKGGEENRNKANKMSLYRRAWWIMENADRDIMLSDQYSIVLGTLLLAVSSNADIILASPWESGLAQCLQEETRKYKKDFPNWTGRRWVEYADCAVPDWEALEEHAGVVISVSEQNCADILFSELLAGRRRLRRDVLVLWNIWSDQPDKSVRRAIRAAGQFEGNAKKDLLTVFSSWQTEGWTEEKLPYTFLVQETANEWLKRQPLEDLLQESFLLSLKSEETDAVAWEVFLQYKENRTEAWDEIFKNFLDLCSDSVRALISFCEGEWNTEDLLHAEPLVFKKWYATVKEEDCGKILAALKKNKLLYWSAILINPYCTRHVLQEWGERKLFAQLLLDQDVTGSNDLSLLHEAEEIRRQIRPV